MAIISILCSLHCTTNDESKSLRKGTAVVVKKDSVQRLPGRSEPLPGNEIEQGEVLIAYSDCYTCHTTDTKAKGPAFRAIAKRYPANKGYIELLARKVIAGGSGIWGYPVMTPHPELSIEHARLMVKYILSLEQNSGR